MEVQKEHRIEKQIEIDNILILSKKDNYMQCSHLSPITQEFKVSGNQERNGGFAPNCGNCKCKIEVHRLFGLKIEQAHLGMCYYFKTNSSTKR